MRLGAGSRRPRPRPKGGPCFLGNRLVGANASQAVRVSRTCGFSSGYFWVESQSKKSKMPLVYLCVCDPVLLNFLSMAPEGPELRVE